MLLVIGWKLQKKTYPLTKRLSELRLFVSPWGLEQQVVGGGGGMVKGGRRGRHPLETFGFVACVRAPSARD